jgi:hypothetical protein
MWQPSRRRGCSEPRCHCRPRLLHQRRDPGVRNADITVTLPKPMNSMQKQKRVLASGTSATSLKRTSKSVLPENGSPPAILTKKTGWCCAATGPTLARTAPSNINAPPGKSAASRDGKTSTFLKRFSAGSMNTREDGVSVGRGSSLRFAPSKPAWARSASRRRHCHASRPRWHRTCSATISPASSTSSGFGHSWRR